MPLTELSPYVLEYRRVAGLTSLARERLEAISFFLLGDIVRRVSGMRLDEFAKAHIFEPLGMKDTMFLPPESLRPRIAPTEPSPFGDRAH